MEGACNECSVGWAECVWASREVDLAQCRGDTLHVHRTCKGVFAAASQWGVDNQVDFLSRRLGVPGLSQRSPVGGSSESTLPVTLPCDNDATIPFNRCQSLGCRASSHVASRHLGVPGSSQRLGVSGNYTERVVPDQHRVQRPVRVFSIGTIDVEAAATSPAVGRPDLILVDNDVSGERRPGVGAAHDQPVVNVPHVAVRDHISIVVHRPTIFPPVPVQPIQTIPTALQDALPRSPGEARHRADGERARDAQLRPQQQRVRSAGDVRHRVRGPVTRRCRGRHCPRLPWREHFRMQGPRRSRLEAGVGLWG